MAINHKEQAEAQMDEDLQTLEMNIRQLKIQFDMYFVGSLKKPPYQLRSTVIKTIKRYGESRVGKYQQRFQFNTLVSRFNVLNELWSKKVRDREEGARRPPAILERKHRDQMVASCRVGDPSKQQDALRTIHQKFLMQREAAGQAKPVSFEKFLKGVTAQTAQLQKSSDCGEIELRVVVADGKVQLKARGVKS